MTKKGISTSFDQQRQQRRENRIEQLKAACDSIKANAADFIGDEEFPCGWTVSIVMEPNAVPVIRLERESLPAEVVKRDDLY
jgi:hypothetical protein